MQDIADNIIVGVPTLRRFDLLTKLIASAENGLVRPSRYMIIDNSGGGLHTYWQTNAPELLDNSRVLVAVSHDNLGVARSWNLLIRDIYNQYGSYALISNDDLEYNKTTLKLFADNLHHVSHKYPIHCCGGMDALNAFSLFLTRYDLLYNTVGHFDETIWPAYHEDGDMYHRLRLLGRDLFRIDDCTATHLQGGSATIKTYTKEEMQEHHRRFERNRYYITLKWGNSGEAWDTREWYTSPFDGQDIMGKMQELYAMFGK